MSDHANAKADPPPSEADFEAAELVIGRMSDAPAEGTPQYAKLREALASLRVRFGADRFAFLYGLRGPRNGVERLEREHQAGKLTDAQFRDRLKAYAERPVDAEMLGAFCDAYEERITAYADMLQTIVSIATDQRDIDGWEARRREPDVDAAVERMDARLGLFTDELRTVFEFLTELQAEKGVPVHCGTHSGDSAHWIAALVLDDASRSWRSCRDIADRSQSSGEYLYATTASKLFYETHIKAKSLPLPNDLSALLRLERAHAHSVLNDRAKQSSELGARIQAVSVSITSERVEVIGSIGASDASEAEELKPKSSGAVSKPDGWTRAELIAQAQYDGAACSPTTFDNIRKAAKIPPAKKGGAGAQRRFSVAQLRKLIAAAETGTYRNGSKIASAWRELLRTS